jgi:repressor LexA
MRKNLTVQQGNVLTVIKDLTIKLGKPPTLEEIRKASGHNYISAVQRHVEALKDKDYLSHIPNQSRSLQPSYFGQKINIPLVGNVAAGTPILATQNIEAYIPYESKRIKVSLNNYFFLKAIGDSMNKADVYGRTIDNGDYVLVRKQNTANLGEIVVALIGDDATIKRLKKTEGHIILEPISSNPANKPIYIFEDFLIQGIVVDVMKVGDSDVS